MSPRLATRPLLLLATLIIVTGASAHADAGDVPPEYRAKAAFIQRFLEFVVWTDGDARLFGPISIGVVGDSPLEAALRDLVAEPGTGRELRMCPVDELAATGCDVLFVSATIDGEPRAAHPVWRDVRRLTATGTLTIGEDEQFHAAGGVIDFFAQGERLRFSISRAAAADAGLSIGSKLLRLARIED